MSVQENKAMMIGNWIVTFIILAIPLVGFVMYFVWAFSSDTQPSKKTFCQASLILTAVCIVLAIVFLFALGGLSMVLDQSAKHGAPR